MADTALAEIEVGGRWVRAVRGRPTHDIREALNRSGMVVGEEIVRLHSGDRVVAYVTSERPAMAVFPESNALVFGLLPEGAVDVEAVTPDGQRISCTVGPGIWMVVLPHDERGGEIYPVLFRDPVGQPVNPGLPSDWRREPVERDGVPCPACGAGSWELVTPEWEGTGRDRNARWGDDVAGPTPAYVCDRCGHEERRHTQLTLRPVRG